jgi:hypothetical protein
MLDKRERIIHVENKGARVLEIFNQVCQDVNLKETEYFGLATKQDHGEFHFVANDTKLHKLAPKVWKAKDCSVDEPLLTFHFRVQYYVDNIGLLRERATRLQYYLQLRDNLLHYSQSVTEEKCFLLAGLALQADYGVYNEEHHVGAYFDPREFFPAWVLMRRGQDYITHHLPSIHRDMSGMSRAEARVQYIRDLSMPPSTHNVHFYQLRRRKYDPPPGNEWLAVCPKGIEVYEVAPDGLKNLLSTFLWSNIGKLSCEKKKFEIIADGFAERRFVYYASSKESGEHLLEMCRATHRFQLQRQPILAELRRLEEQDLRGGAGQDSERYVYRESHNLSSVDGDRDRSRASSTPAGSANDRRSILMERYAQNAARGASSPPAAPGFCSSTPISGETRPMEIMIDSPPQVVSNSPLLQQQSLSSLTMVTPITSLLTKWTPTSFDVPSGSEGTESRAARTSSRKLQQRFLPQQQQLSTASSSVVTPTQSFAFGRGSFLRMSVASSTNSFKLRNSSGGSRTAGAERTAAALSILRPSAAKFPSSNDDNDDSFAPVTSIVTTPINAASLQRAMPHTQLNDVMADLWSGKSVAVHSMMPQRKSSLVYPRNSPSPAAGDSSSVVRSTSLRQPTKPELEEWPAPRLTSALARQDLSESPVAVEAHFQRIPFNSLTVTSSPVCSIASAVGTGSALPGGQVIATPPSYQLPPSYYQGLSLSHAEPSSSNAFATQLSQMLLLQQHHAPTSVSSQVQYDAISLSSVPTSVAVTEHFHPTVNHFQSDHPRYFDHPSASDSSCAPSSDFLIGDSSSSQYRLITTQASIMHATPRLPPLTDDVVSSLTVLPSLHHTAAPPTYDMARSRKMANAAATPPASRRYVAEPGSAQQRFDASVSNRTDVPPLSLTSSAVHHYPLPAYMPNGDATIQTPVGTSQVLMKSALHNGHHEPTTNGYVGSAGGAYGKQQVASSSTLVLNHVRGPPLLPRQSSSTSDSDGTTDIVSQCPQHGSGLNIVHMIKSNIDAQSVPMLKALCNDRSLLTSCTCRQPPLDAADNSHQRRDSSTVVRRLSLGQPLSAWSYDDPLPGTVVRPYSWGSEQYAKLLQLQFADIDLDSSVPADVSHTALTPNGNGGGSKLMANGSAARSHGLVHRHSDGAAFEHALRVVHAAAPNRSDSLAPHGANFIVA